MISYTLIPQNYRDRGKVTQKIQIRSLNKNLIKNAKYSELLKYKILK